MKEERRFVQSSSEYVVKNRNSSGCLIVRKKSVDDGTSRVNGIGSSGHGNGFCSREKNKRHRIESNESKSGGELSSPVSHRLQCNERRLYNALHSVPKRTRIDLFDFDEYNGNGVVASKRKRMDEAGVKGAKPYESLMENGYEIGSNVHDVGTRKTCSFLNIGPIEMKERERTRHHIEQLRDQDHFSEPIRVQGRNGVLKVMVNKKNSVANSGSLCINDRGAFSADNKGRMSNAVKECPPDSAKKTSSCIVDNEVSSREFVNSERNPLSLKLAKSCSNSITLKEKFTQVKSENDEANTSKKGVQAMKCNIQATDSEGSDTSTKMKLKKNAPSKQVLENGKQGKITRGTGTEKQKLREKIKQMLLDAGWTIDYRPRRNREYLDAVYINPSGTAYWSIIKAYEALRKQLNDVDEEAKFADEEFTFALLPDELLKQLTRKTKKKMEKEMKNKLKKNGAGENRGASERNSSANVRDECLDTDSKEKLNACIKMGLKSSKRTNGMCYSNKGDRSSYGVPDVQEKPSSGSVEQKRKNRKVGRCTLLARNSGDGPDSGSDGFTLNTGKRTVLSWLIDCGVVRLSQKVLYMNRRRTKAMLEGWLTPDGIHCGCCSKILSVSKFEIHAGSKLRQPYNNICLESGVSLLQCQVDAWNREKSSKKIEHYLVDVDSGDPNDDTCCLCGDGGDLLCCDGCPSTFHQNCLDIAMLPPGDWRCPNCTCKYCDFECEKLFQGDEEKISSVLTCNLCAKKYHKSCVPEAEQFLINSDASTLGFCGVKCRELADELQKCLGVKHELEGGFTWSLIHRIDDSDVNLLELPQKMECNAKAAVASVLMDECFLPIIDRRSGINVIRNVVYNCGSNFSRLNFDGFYTVVLEKGDELISAASLRFHGVRLAEMPFIGTRHIYRRQGMWRRLMNAIESMLTSFKIERLIIPAISDLKSTWTEAFGFSSVDQSLKTELRSTSVLVFPGVDMLVKLFRQSKTYDVNVSPDLKIPNPAVDGNDGADLSGTCAGAEEEDGKKTEEKPASDALRNTKDLGVDFGRDDDSKGERVSDSRDGNLEEQRTLPDGENPSVGAPVVGKEDEALPSSQHDINHSIHVTCRNVISYALVGAPDGSSDETADRNLNFGCSFVSNAKHHDMSSDNMDSRWRLEGKLRDNGAS